MLARILLASELGQRLPNIAELRSQIGVGAGTVQKALQELQQDGFVTIDSKQRQGTHILGRHVGALWKTANLPTLTAVLPLPNSWEFQGLATGLRAQLDEIGIPSTFLYGHGSEQRIQALGNGLAQIAVMSLHAARQWVATEPRVAIDQSFPSGSYYAPDSVLVIARDPRGSLKSGLRVGIDRLSADHTHLTQREFPTNSYVDVSYAQLPSALTRGIIDAAVWHRTALGLSLDDQGLTTWPLGNHGSELIDLELNSAALVRRADDLYTRSVLDQVDSSRVLDLQKGVVAGDLLPVY